MNGDPAATLQALAQHFRDLGRPVGGHDDYLDAEFRALAEHVDAVRHDEQLQDWEYPPLVVRTLLAVAAAAGVKP